MSRLIITGKKPLRGRIRVSGAKNSVLPIIAASLLTEGLCIVNEIPDLNDVRIMCDLLRTLGAHAVISEDTGRLQLSACNIISVKAPYELVNKMRASFLILGPLLTRTGTAEIPLPGGCPIGTRPVDLHLKGLQAMGADIVQEHGYIKAKTNGRLCGSEIYLDFPSVGATENLMMAAALAEGQTVIENAAVEPEVIDLAAYLVSMGADIKGAGTDTVKINGVKELEGVKHTVIPDRIEAGTFMVAAAITGGDVTIDNVIPEHLKPVSAKLKETGVEIAEELTSVHVYTGKGLKPTDIKTHPYPGFPTDMQAQMTSLLSRAEGTSIITETIFENRFMHIGELKRMGASIRIEGRSAVIEGMSVLAGARVCATDLRAGAALVLAGLCAEDKTEISGIEHIDRGYVRIDDKLRSLGAGITRLEGD